VANELLVQAEKFSEIVSKISMKEAESIPEKKVGAVSSYSNKIRGKHIHI